jgi:hypothetical protein
MSSDAASCSSQLARPASDSPQVVDFSALSCAFAGLIGLTSQLHGASLTAAARSHSTWKLAHTDFLTLRLIAPRSSETVSIPWLCVASHVSFWAYIVWFRERTGDFRASLIFSRADGGALIGQEHLRQPPASYLTPHILHGRQDSHSHPRNSIACIGCPPPLIASLPDCALLSLI